MTNRKYHGCSHFNLIIFNLPLSQLLYTYGPLGQSFDLQFKCVAVINGKHGINMCYLLQSRTLFVKTRTVNQITKDNTHVMQK